MGLLTTSHGHSGTYKQPELPPQPHRDRPPQRWRVWPGREPGGRQCWPGGSPLWRWPYWSRETKDGYKTIAPSCPPPPPTSPVHQALDPHPAGECQVLRLREMAREALLGPLYTYSLREVEGSNAQRPEAAEHGEEREPQVVPGRQGKEGVFTLTLRGGAIALQESESLSPVPLISL